jgi:curved DNA-binding protein
VEFAADPLYRAEGKDLFIDLPITPWEAALGADVKTPTPTGSIMLKVPPNSAHGKELRAKGKGIPAATPGDLHVRLVIVLPKGDTAKAKELYAQMARDLAFNPRAKMEG